MQPTDYVEARKRIQGGWYGIPLCHSRIPQGSKETKAYHKGSKEKGIALMRVSLLREPSGTQGAEPRRTHGIFAPPRFWYGALLSSDSSLPTSACGPE
jgi:hypothetical protein